MPGRSRLKAPSDGPSAWARRGRRRRGRSRRGRARGASASPAALSRVGRGGAERLAVRGRLAGWTAVGARAGTAPGPVPRSCVMLYTLAATSRAPPRKSTRLSTVWAMATASCPFLLRRMLSPIDGPAAQRARGRPAVMDDCDGRAAALSVRGLTLLRGDGTAEGVEPATRARRKRCFCESLQV